MPGEIWELISLIEDAKRGQWPLGHGTLNETASFYDAYKFYLNSVASIQQSQK